mmetsp:Transcript_43670/g.52346  ORF Transcript_43670/g.52346 Transcript_43670/m.52346 type:complete len:357 (+) Transcript_43670:446-1516(+)
MRPFCLFQSIKYLLIFSMPFSSSLATDAGSSSGRSINIEQRPGEFYPSFFENLPSMKGKTVVITGFSRGLGYVTALSVAKKGATVFLLNRKSERAEESAAAIAAATPEGTPSPRQIECDLLDFASVRTAAKLVKDFAPDGGAVDVLCCNAGIMLQPDEASADGYDITASTNMLSHFLLTKELMPSLEKAAAVRGEARIVTMSSGSGFGKPSFNAKFFERNGGKLGDSSYERYHQSKLANLVFTKALDDKLRAKNSNVIAVACHPGVCATDMLVHVRTTMKKGLLLDSVPTAEDGSIAQLKCICESGIKSGDLWGPDFESQNEVVRNDISPPLVLVDENVKTTLWKLCEKATGVFEL